MFSSELPNLFLKRKKHLLIKIKQYNLWTRSTLQNTESNPKKRGKEEKVKILQNVICLTRTTNPNLLLPSNLIRFCQVLHDALFISWLSSWSVSRPPCFCTDFGR